jgi:hypothetical protein
VLLEIGFRLFRIPSERHRISVRVVPMPRPGCLTFRNEPASRRHDRTECWTRRLHFDVRPHASRIAEPRTLSPQGATRCAGYSP